jgi:hypothetical protein
MRRHPLFRPISRALIGGAFLLLLVVQAPVSLAQTEEPAAAVNRFYQEYMSMGVALKPLGDRWFTPRFRRVMNPLDVRFSR